MPRLLLPLLLFAAFLPGWGRAADEKPVPKAPFVAAVPTTGHWKIDCKYKSPDAKGTDAMPGTPPPPKVPEGWPASLDFVRMGKMLRVTLGMADGTALTVDLYGNVSLAKTQSGWHITPVMSDFPPYPFYSTGFPRLDWMSLDNFKDVVKRGEVDCFHYVQDDREAWIAVDSNLPVAAKDMQVELSFQFLEAPTSPISYPPDEMNAINVITHPIKPSF